MKFCIVQKAQYTMGMFYWQWNNEYYITAIKKKSQGLSDKFSIFSLSIKYNEYNPVKQSEPHLNSQTDIEKGFMVSENFKIKI